jgi:hypothetical protein
MSQIKQTADYEDADAASYRYEMVLIELERLGRHAE